MRDNAATVYAGPQQHRSRPRPQLPIGGGYTPVVPADTGSSSYAPPQSTHAQSTSYGNGNGNGMPDSTSTYIPSSAYTPSSQNTVRVSPAGTGTGTGTIASTWTPPANTATDTNNGVGTGTGTVTDTGIGAGTGTTSISSWQPDTTSGASDSTGSAAASTPPAGAPEPPVAGGAGVDLTGATRSGKACVTIHGDSLITGGACGPLVSDGSLPCVAIPHAIFFPNTPNGNGNLNPLCGKTVTITKAGGTPVKAMITDSNTANPAQDCGLGFPYSFDSSNALWAAIGGTDGLLEQISFVIDAP